MRLCPLFKSPVGCYYGASCYDRHQEFRVLSPVEFDDDVPSNTASSTTLDHLKTTVIAKENVFIVDIKQRISGIKNACYQHHIASLDMLSEEHKIEISEKCKSILKNAAAAIDSLEVDLMGKSEKRKALFQHLQELEEREPVKEIADDNVLETNPFLSDEDKLKADLSVNEQNDNGLNRKKRSREDMLGETDMNEVKENGMSGDTLSASPPKRQRLEEAGSVIVCSSNKRHFES